MKLFFREYNQAEIYTSVIILVQFLNGLKCRKNLSASLHCRFTCITVPQDPKILKDKVLEVAALYLASGIDPQNRIFLYNLKTPITVFSLILNTITPFGQLERMTQFKINLEELFEMER